MIRKFLLVFSICLLMVPCMPIDVAAQDDLPPPDSFQEFFYLEIADPPDPEDPPEDIMAWVSMPKSVLEGETAVLRVTIENGWAKDDYRMSEIDIYDDFLDGFKIISIVPEPRHMDHSHGALTLEYPIDLSPREEWELEITLQAEKAGVYVGDVDVTAGDDFLTRIAQARVY